MGGGLMQLVAYGAQDIYLTGNPQITFFKVVYRRHTNFSMEAIRQTFKGTVGAGARVVATLARNGDLVHDCFITVPSWRQQTSQYDNNPGHNMIDYIECEIGGQLIDKHYGKWMEVHSELTEKGDAYATAAEDGGMIGFGVNRARGSQFQQTAFAGGVLGTTNAHIPISFVPLRFWFCRHVGLSLPLIALQYHEVNINIKFTGGGFFNNQSAGSGKPELWCNYIYLDTDERRRFAQVSHEYLIEQVQQQSFTGNTTALTLKLNFNHPVKELIWALTEAAWGTKGTSGGKLKALDNGAVGSLTNTDTWQLKLNGHDRFEKQPITYFTRYQPYKYHTGSSRGTSTGAGDSIGVYSFALKPEEHQPSGTCNFSRIDNSQLITSGTNTGILHVYAVNYNVLRIMSGMGGLAYSN